MNNLELINNIYDVNDPDTSNKIMKYQENIVFNKINVPFIEYIYMLQDIYIPGADNFGNVYIVKLSKDKCYRVIHGICSRSIDVYNKKIYLKDLYFFGERAFVNSVDVINLSRKYDIYEKHEKVSIPEYFNIQMKSTKDILTNIENLNIDNDVKYLYDINGNLSTMINPITDSFMSKDFYMYCMNIINNEDEYNTLINH